MKINTYQEGDKIISEGEKGVTFYFIKEGTAEATQRNEQTGENNVVYSYKENDYFGELALLKNEPRAATITATSELVTASIDRLSFKRLLGPLEEILKRNSKRYDMFMNN